MLSYHPCPSHPLHLLLMNFYDIIIRTPSYYMSSYVSCHILNYAIPCHHYLSISLSLSCHHIHWLFLYHSWTPLTSMRTITQICQQGEFVEHVCHWWQAINDKGVIRVDVSVWRTLTLCLDVLDMPLGCWCGMMMLLVWICGSWTDNVVWSP